jgi:branched-chain amino acid transport system permease protein
VIELAINGAVLGGVYAAVAIAVVLMFQTLGTVNFAATTVGGLGAVATILVGEAGASPAVALLAGLGTAGLVGAGVGALMLWRFGAADTTTRSTVTIVLLVAGMALGSRLLGSDAHSFPDVSAGAKLTIGSVSIPVATLVEVGAVFVLAFGARAFLLHSRVGVQLRALATRPVTAKLVGIRVGALTIGVWAFTSVVSAAAVFVILPTSTFSFATTTTLLIGALAAALIGMLRSLPLAAFGGLALGILQSLAVIWPVMVDLNQVIPFAVIIAIRLWWRRNDVWSEAR